MLDIKHGINKKKTLTQILINDYDYANMIIRIISDKFNYEHIVDSKIKADVSICFANNIVGLIDVISIDTLSIDDYITENFLH